MATEAQRGIIAEVKAMATRIAARIREGAPINSLAVAVEGTAETIAEMTEREWTPYAAKISRSGRNIGLCQAMIIDQLLALGLDDEAIDPVRDAMDDLYSVRDTLS